MKFKMEPVKGKVNLLEFLNNFVEDEWEIFAILPGQYGMYQILFRKVTK